MSNLLRDLRYSLRLLRRTPAFSAVAIGVLALGIGANTAVFSLVNTLLLRPRLGRIDQAVGVFSRDRTKPDSFRDFSYPAYVDLRDRSGVFESLMAHTFSLVGVRDGDTTRRTFASLVSANYFSTLGVSLAAGRTFTADEERPGAGVPVAIASYDVWRRAGFDPGARGPHRARQRHRLHDRRHRAERVRRHDGAALARVLVPARRVRRGREPDVQVGDRAASGIARTTR